MPSPSSRRAWIEIALRPAKCNALDVALLAEGVDRNKLVARLKRQRKWSPSSRRAWIEIQIVRDLIIRQMVALLAEGVDRNR